MWAGGWSEPRDEGRESEVASAVDTRPGRPGSAADDSPVLPGLMLLMTDSHKGWEKTSHFLCSQGRRRKSARNVFVGRRTLRVMERALDLRTMHRGHEPGSGTCSRLTSAATRFMGSGGGKPLDGSGTGVGRDQISEDEVHRRCGVFEAVRVVPDTRLGDKSYTASEQLVALRQQPSVLLPGERCRGVVEKSISEMCCRGRRLGFV